MLGLKIALLLPLLAIGQSNLPFESDDGRPWLDPQTRASSPLAAAARASALNQNSSAEQQLRAIIRKSPRSSDAGEAHKLLSRIYTRTGRYKHAIDNLTDWLRDFPQSDAAKSEQEDLDQMRGLPDQSNGPRRAATLKHDNDLFVPVTINGKPSTFLIDTGADVSVISEQAAQHLGLSFREGTATLGDSSGKGAPSRRAVAKELVLGNMRFYNVTFWVIPDQEPYNELPVDHRGILGAPIQHAIGTVQWSKSGTVRVGEKLPRQGAPNLAYFRNKPIVQSEIAGRSAFFTLDSGAVDTDLNSNFLEAFAAFAANANQSKKEITGVGGTVAFDSYVLDELKLSIATQSLTLRPANITAQKILGGDCCIGNFGDDLLMQSGQFTLDFDNMSLRFR